MNKCIIILGFSFLINLSLISQIDSGHMYTPRLIKEIPFGSATNNLGYWELPGSANIASGPQIYLEEAYVMDTDNQRVVVFDKSSFDVKRIISIKDLPTSDGSFKVCPNGDMVWITYDSFYRIKNDGTLLFKTFFERPGKFIRVGFFWVTEELIIYLDTQGTYQVIDYQGKTLNETEKKALEIKLKAPSKLRKESTKLQQAIDSFLQTNHVWLLEDRLLTWGADIYVAFFELLAQNSQRQYYIPKTAEFSLIYGMVSKPNKPNIIYLRVQNIQNDYPMYYAFTYDGQLLDYFDFKPIVYLETQNDGNFYSCVSDRETQCYYIYRYLLNTEVANKAVVKTLEVSSLLTEAKDPKAYDPIKVFDGKADTGWFENSPDSGLGEWLEISFTNPLEIDEIRISPGWFDARYWKSNNRLKTINLIPDGAETLAQKMTFEDVMEYKTLDFEKPLKLQKLRIQIEAVWPGNTWNDTPITEIELYNKGVKYQLDFSQCTSY